MSVTLTQIREGLAANLTAAYGSDIQVSAYMLANPTPPCIHLFPGNINGDVMYDLTMRRGLDKWPFTVQAFYPLIADIASQMNLDKLLAPAGTMSLKVAIESDKTLGGTVQDLHVVSTTGYRSYALEGRPPILAASWLVDVYATGL